MKTTLLFLSVFLSANLFGQNVYIPDPYFKEALILNGVDTSNDGEIQISEANSFVGPLFAKSFYDQPDFADLGWGAYEDSIFYFISDLTGIEAFTSLGTILFYSNQLTEVDLSECVSLGSCNIERNPLSCLNVKNGQNNVNGLLYECYNIYCVEVENPEWCFNNWLYENQGNNPPNGPFSADCNNNCSSSTAGINELTSSKNLNQILDLMGRETSFKPNTPLIYVYDDGSIEKVFSVEY